MCLKSNDEELKEIEEIVLKKLKSIELDHVTYVHIFQYPMSYLSYFLMIFFFRQHPMLYLSCFLIAFKVSQHVLSYLSYLLITFKVGNTLWHNCHTYCLGSFLFRGACLQVFDSPGCMIGLKNPACAY